MESDVEMPKFSPVRTIRRYCLKCVEGPKAVRECDDYKCELRAYRFGQNPRRRGIGGNPSLRHCPTHG